MYEALRLLPPLAALLLASSAGPEAATRPPFVPSVAVERSVLNLAGKRFVMTKTIRTFPLVFNWDVESLGRRHLPSSETVTLARIEGAATASDRRWNAIARARIAAIVR